MVRKLRMLTIITLMVFTMIGSVFVVNAEAPIKVAFIGDSITWGTGTTNSTKSAYPILVGKMLGNAYEVRNYGVPGTTMLKQGTSSYWNTAEYKNSKAWNPDIVVIMLGTNDSEPQNWQFKASFIPNYEEMINTYKNLNSHPKVYVNNVPKIYIATKDAIIKNEINVQIFQITKDTKVPLTDVYSVTNGMPRNFPDNIHPNDAGALIIAKAVNKTLVGLLLEHFQTQ